MNAQCGSKIHGLHFLGKNFHCPLFTLKTSINSCYVSVQSQSTRKTAVLKFLQW